MIEKDWFIGDLHIHSRFSRACSSAINIPNLVKWARIKGVDLLGTGDFTHPEWISELKELREDEGIYYYEDFPFVLSSEISLIYTQNDKGRRVHLVYLAPSLEVVDKINQYLDTKGRRDYDGRPIFKISCRDFVKAMKEIDERIEIIPAHIWTPWFGVFGSKGGFNNLDEAFGDMRNRIHAIETGISCYDEKTEVLTNTGWKRFNAVNKEDEICTLNNKNNNIEYQKALNIFKRKYHGKMYKLKTKRVDLLVTPNHKLFVGHCDFRKPVSFALRKSEEMINKSKRFKKDGIWVGVNPDNFILPAVKIKCGSKYYSGKRDKPEKIIPIKKWLKFFGFWTAEGCTYQGKYGDYGVYIYNNDREILLEMKSILEDFGYNPFIYKNILRVRDYQLFSYLKQFGKSRDKFIPNRMKFLSKELLKIFFDYYIKGDGHRYGRNKKGLFATTISKKLRDDLQEIALKIGFSAYYKLHNKKGILFKSPGYDYKKEYKQSADSWVIYFIRQNIHTVLPSTIKKWNYEEKWVDYKGDVYCVQVPNHVIYVRRNGIPVWCGNSDPAMNWKIKDLERISIISFSDAHSFWPWRLGREATIFKLNEGEKISYDLILKQIRENSFIGTIETDPAYGKYHYDGHRSCDFSCSHLRTKELNGICPKCNTNLIIGVDYRVEELASKDADYQNKKQYYTLLPLHELISLALGMGMNSKSCWRIYNELIECFGNEFKVLLDVPKIDLAKALKNEILVDLIIFNRQGRIRVKPGYDGVYGEAVLPEKQSRLF